MRFQHKNGLVALMLVVVIFAITACSSAMKEDYATASNTEQSDMIQAPSDSVTPSTEPASASPATATATASESPSPVAEESHQHDPSSEPSPTPTPKPSPEPTKKPAKETEDKAQTVVVEIKDFAISPEKVTIRKGSTVIFINRDKVKHTATADGGEFDTGLLGKDVSGKVKFDETGTFTFYCSPHPGMTGTIVVEDK
jgi:plastocyanin